jgi:hypothetical protein
MCVTFINKYFKAKKTHPIELRKKLCEKATINQYG